MGRGWVCQRRLGRPGGRGGELSSTTYAGADQTQFAELLRNRNGDLSLRSPNIHPAFLLKHGYQQVHGIWVCLAQRGGMKPRKLSLSRKGFDNSYGGCPSPIFPDGTIYSLPIPGDDAERPVYYEDLQYENINKGQRKLQNLASRRTSLK